MVGTSILGSWNSHWIHGGTRIKILSSSDPHLETLFWHSFWHSIWKCFCGIKFWHSIWHSFSGISSEILCAWGPGTPLILGLLFGSGGDERLQLRSGGEGEGGGGQLTYNNPHLTGEEKWRWGLSLFLSEFDLFSIFWGFSNIYTLLYCFCVVIEQLWCIYVCMFNMYTCLCVNYGWSTDIDSDWLLNLLSLTIWIRISSIFINIAWLMALTWFNTLQYVFKRPYISLSVDQRGYSTKLGWTRIVAW